MKIESWSGAFRIENADTDLEHQTVSGVFISETPNNLDQIFDYATSKPYIAQWSRHFQDVTNGASYGNVRVMHHDGTVDAVGIVTALKFNDKAKTVSGTVHVSDPLIWKKIVEHVYTGFSFGGDSKGPLWKDRIASAKFGRLMRRYTFVPRELTLCDKGRVPGTDFTTIKNADTQEARMPEPNGEKIENGVATGAYLAQVLAQAVDLINAVAREEVSEGQTSAVPDALREAIKPFAEAVKAYQSSQVDELVKTGEDVDAFSPDDVDVPDIPDDAVENADVGAAKPNATTVENGDVPGHEFHGNQQASGTSGSASGKASTAAHKASVAAASNGNRNGHKIAGAAHTAAAAAATAAGRTKVAAYHKEMAEHHTAMVGKIKNTDTKACSQADVKSNVGKPATVPATTPAPAKEPKVENADVSAPNVAELFGKLNARFDAIESKISAPIQNADTAPKAKPFAGPGHLGVVVTREQESSVVENSDIDKEATRIANLPEERRGFEILKHQIRSSINH